MALPDYQKKLLPWSGGLNTAAEPSAIGDDELTVATGCEYHVGTPHLYKQPGRSLAATLPGANQSIRAIHQFQYDNAISKLIAYASDGAMYAADVDLAPTFISDALTITGTATPHFNSYNQQWIMCNGVDRNFIREPTPPAPNTGYSGNWRPAGMQPAFGQTVVASVAAAVAAPSAGERDWTNAVSGANFQAFANPTYAYDFTTDPPYGSTYAEGYRLDGDGSNHTWAYTTSYTTSLTNFTLNILFQYDFKAAFSYNNAIEVAFDATAGVVNSGTFQATSFRNATAGSNSPTYLQIPIPSTCTNLNRVRVRARVDNSFSNGVSLKIYDLRMVNNATTSTGAVIITNPISYLVTERYYDGDGVSHESEGTAYSVPQSFEDPGVYAIKVYLPGVNGDATGTVARNNPMTTEFVIYRTIDEPGGGWPYFWEIATVSWSNTNGGGGSTIYYYDTFELSTTEVSDKNHLYDVLQVLFPTGEVLFFPLNAPPPLSTMTLVYQGSILYFPVDQPSRVFYSVPTTISTRAAEQVPAVYYLDFQTPTNDTATSGTVCNQGLTCLIYFPSYTMVVHYLPQANDPGVFDNRVKEFVSQVRGAAGRFCSTTISLPQGGQLGVAVDKLGIWATDGVSGIADWSRDLRWTTNARDGLMDGVDLSTAKLEDNGEMRRLELIYTDVDGALQELHIFYGEMKEGNMPKILGPHPAGDGTSLTPGWQCAHYVFADTDTPQWLGWKGSGYADGKVFLERIDTDGAAIYSDASHAYNSDGDIPWVATNGYPYIAGLGEACIIEQGVPKFETTPTKDFTITGSFKRDGSTATISVEKDYEANGSDTKLYWHRYCDRHQLTIEDISNTRSPALIAYQLYYRDSGLSKEGA